MSSDRINARLPEPLAKHVSRVVGSAGLYETPSEYVRELIRRDMDSGAYTIYREVIGGWQDIAKGRYFEGSGDFKKDMQSLARKQAEGW